jgi:hypothetical protein
MRNAVQLMDMEKPVELSSMQEHLRGPILEDDDDSNEVAAMTISQLSTPAPPQLHPPQDKEEATSNTNKADLQYPGKARLLVILIALSCGVFEVGLAENIVATVAPTITNHFHSTHDIGWYGSS